MDDESGELTEKDEVTGVQENQSQSQIGTRLSGEKEGVDSRDKVRHNEKNDQ